MQDVSIENNFLRSQLQSVIRHAKVLNTCENCKGDKSHLSAYPESDEQAVVKCFSCSGTGVKSYLAKIEIENAVKFMKETVEVEETPFGIPSPHEFKTEHFDV